jgi:hypothetical protein
LSFWVEPHAVKKRGCRWPHGEGFNQDPPMIAFLPEQDAPF